MLRSLKTLFYSPPKPLNLKTLERVSSFNIHNREYDYYDKFKKRKTAQRSEFMYYDKETKKQIAFASFSLDSGQIGLVDVNPEYRRRKLGTQIVEEIEEELKKYKISEVWVTCSKDHFYWSKYPGFEFDGDYRFYKQII